MGLQRSYFITGCFFYLREPTALNKTGLGYPQTIAIAVTVYIIGYYFGVIRLYQGLRAGSVM